MYRRSVVQRPWVTEGMLRRQPGDARERLEAGAASADVENDLHANLVLANRLWRSRMRHNVMLATALVLRRRPRTTVSKSQTGLSEPWQCSRPGALKKGTRDMWNWDEYSRAEHSTVHALGPCTPPWAADRTGSCDAHGCTCMWFGWSALHGRVTCWPDSTGVYICSMHLGRTWLTARDRARCSLVHDCTMKFARAQG